MAKLTDKKQPSIDDMRVQGPTEGTSAQKPADEIRVKSQHEETVEAAQAARAALLDQTSAQREDEKNPTTYGDYKSKGDSPKAGDSVFYIVQDGATAGAFRPAIVVSAKGDVCELRVFFSNDDDGRTPLNVVEVSRTGKDTAEPGTWSFKASAK